jgi:hypothetical protein
MIPEDLPFRVIRVNSEDEVLARANLLVGRAAYETALRLYPKDTIQYREKLVRVAMTRYGGLASMGLPD